jgi:lipopolysaccharide transport system ATP-binding protein
MSDIVIRAEGLGKKYLIGHQAPGERYTALRDVLARGVRGLARSAGDMLRGRQLVAGDEVEEFWALKDVSFDVKRGEVVGIIGRNGAGKSTLLKILSRITEPTAGCVTIKGRVASLLEVGTGFHPELTGRENIYLNGAILGMSRAEIRKKFDEIVAFAEVEKFLDTPVKRYSSGMYVRLAFAVAAHLEPEILVVDEVLAVGDAEFQKKCLGKMRDVAGLGRTVLFVSHNLGSMIQLCGTAMVLETGRVNFQGSPRQAISEYMRSADNQGEVDLTARRDREGSGAVRVQRIRLCDQDGNSRTEFYIGDDLMIEVGLATLTKLSEVKISIQITTSDGINVANMVDIDSGFALLSPQTTEHLNVSLKDLRFYPGRYFLSVWLGSTASGECYDSMHRCASFDIIVGGNLTNRLLPRSAGIFFLTPRWIRQ